MGPASTTSSLDSSRSRPGCVVLVVRLSAIVLFLCFVFFCFFLFLFFFCVERHPLGSAHHKSILPQPIVDQSTLRPSYSCESSTRLARISPRHLRRLRRNITNNSSPRIPMLTHMSLPGPWTHLCSLQPALAGVRSSRTRTTSCLLVLRSPTTTLNCTG
jgi:hypothetical protein